MRGFFVENGVHARNVAAHLTHTRGVLKLVGCLLKAQIEGFLFQRSQLITKLIGGREVARAGNRKKIGGA